MSLFDEYSASLSPSQRQLFQRIRERVYSLVPSAQEGKSYGMPAFLYKGKPFLSVIVRKDYLSAYPFSGKIIAALQSQLSDFECTSGSIHFSEERPLPLPLLEEIISTRLREIDTSLGGEKK